MSDSLPQTHISQLLNAALAHHQGGRLDAAAELYRQLLAQQPDHALGLNLLGNVEYQQGHTDAALDLIGRAIRHDPCSPVYRIALGHVHRRLGQLPRASACYREALALSAESVLAASSLAHVLKDMGEFDAAIEVLQQLLEVDARHRDGLRLLGDLWVAQGRPAQAVQAYARAVALEPDDAELRFRLGVALSQDGDAAGAAASFERVLEVDPTRATAMYNLGVIDADAQKLATAQAWFIRALQADPEFVDARINLAAVLHKRGLFEQARVHLEAAYRRQCLFVRPARHAQRSVLVLFDAGQGNVNMSHLFARDSNTVIDWMIEYAPADQAASLPAFDLVFNAMGDPDMIGAAAAPAARFIQGCSRPVLNPPERVALTSREKIPALLRGIDALVAPDVWRVVPGTPWPGEVARHLPLLVRPVHTHGGDGMRRIDSVQALERVHAEQVAPLYAAQFVHFASPDGFFRKYRVIFIDREPYPYHLAISPHWLVHYATAQMLDHPWKLAEEQRFLRDPRSVLGASGDAAIRAVGARMDLDYAGVDFTLLGDGRVLVFEANPVMLVHPEDPHGPLAHKNHFVHRILDAFEAMLQRRHRAGSL